MTKLRLRDSLMDILSCIFDSGGKNTTFIKAVRKAGKTVLTPPAG